LLGNFAPRKIPQEFHSRPSFEEFLTKDILERHYSEILNNIPADNEYHDHLKFMVFGALILLTNAKMPQDLKKRILHAIKWDAELKWRWRAIDKEEQKEFLNERKNLIASFRQLVEEYPSNDLKKEK
jgi:hypothetical protein